MGEYTRTGDGVPNLFGLTQFDGKTQFFDEGTYALPQVRHSLQSGILLSDGSLALQK